MTSTPMKCAIVHRDDSGKPASHAGGLPGQDVEGGIGLVELHDVVGRRIDKKEVRAILDERSIIGIAWKIWHPSPRQSRKTKCFDYPIV